MNKKLRSKLEHFTNVCINDRTALIQSQTNLSDCFGMSDIINNIDGRIEILSKHIKDIRIILEETKQDMEMVLIIDNVDLKELDAQRRNA